MADVEEDEFQGAGVGLDFKDLVPLSVSLVPYVVLWPSDLQQGADLESLFLIVIKRAGGLIGALPLGVISDREIASGSSEANPHALLGASTTIMVPGVYQNSQGVWEPSESEVALLVADFTCRRCTTFEAYDRRRYRVLSLCDGPHRDLPGAQSCRVPGDGMACNSGLVSPGGALSKRCSRGDCPERRGNPSGKVKHSSSSSWAKRGYEFRKALSKAKKSDYSCTGRVLGGCPVFLACSVIPDRDPGGQAGGPGAAAGQFIFGAKAVGKTVDFIPGSVKTSFSDYGSIHGEESSEDPTACAYGSAVDTGACGRPCFTSGAGGGTSSCRRRPFSCTGYASPERCTHSVGGAYGKSCGPSAGHPRRFYHIYKRGGRQSKNCRPSWLSTQAFSSRQSKGLWQDGCRLLWRSQS